jgi:predicted component of type VI protein secretion system
MDKCPACGADTRPGDNYCLNCGQRLLPLTPSPVQAQPGIEPTVAAPAGSGDWGGTPGASAGGWPPEANSHAQTVSAGADLPTYREPVQAAAPVAQATLDRIAEPAHLILRSDSGETLQEYPLDKPEIVIGRAPTSDILLSKDKLTSRRHAVVRYENGQYILQDEHSANGTFVDAQQIEEGVPYPLRDGAQVGIGEHELIFRAYASVEDLPTISVSPSIPQEPTFRTQADEMATFPGEMDEFMTMPENEESSAAVATPVEPAQPEPVPFEPVAPVTAPPVEATVKAPQPVVEEPAPEPVVASSSPNVSLETPAPAPVPVSVPASASSPAASLTRSTEGGETSVTFQRLTTLPQPALPELSGLMAALSTLDGQVMALQEQFNSLQEGMRNHEAELAQTTNQLRTGIRRVAERMDNTIADVARSRETLAWAELLQLMEDVMNNPRDIEYVTRLARKARELNKVFQIHQNVLNTMAECNSLLRSMIGDEK